MSPSPRARLAIGIDFGTESGRVVLVDLSDGAELAVEEVVYRHGVIDTTHPTTGAELPPDTALQDPVDYLEVVERGVPAVLQQAGVSGSGVIGLGIDVTACTVLPVTEDGTPLCQLAQWRDHTDAWVKLWKHHSGQPIADRLNEVAAERGESFLDRYGGRLSSEWYFPKLIETFVRDRALFDAMDAFVEATDWITWQLTGSLRRASCTAGYKACWSARDGLPSAAYFDAAFPSFPEPSSKLGTSFFASGSKAGQLRSDLAERLGIAPSCAVAVGNVDSFVSLPGVGVHRPGCFVMVIGTSICDLVIDAREVLMPGITGVVEDGIVPGFFGYEAGQAAVGDMFAWFGRLLGQGATAAPEEFYARLESEAGAIAPGSSGLVALDWWNGNRTILGDADLSGVIAGLSLATTPAEIYRALFESVAFGTRRIIENFEEHTVGFTEIICCGGIAERSPLMMQLLADVTGLRVGVADSRQIPARGSALFGALAAGTDAGGFGDIGAAIESLAPGIARRYEPNPAVAERFKELYGIFSAMHDTFGRDRVEWLHQLKRMRRNVLEEPR
jgi:L-ribulokinase